MTTRLLPTLAALAASVALGANLISSGSAQAAISDFNAVWDDNTTTKGWIEVDNTKTYQGSYQYSNYGYDYRSWGLDSLLDADFTHEGTRYGKSNLTGFSFYSYIFPESSYYQPLYGSAANFLTLWVNNQYFNLNDNGVDGSTHSYLDGGYKYNSTNWTYTGAANSVNVVERSAEAVPEPTTTAGLALVGLGIVSTRRKQTKASVTV